MTTEKDAGGKDADRRHSGRLLREMLRIRRFEEKCAELYSAEKIRGFLHLYIGEEAVAVGAMQALRRADAVVATYREHGHALARGIPMRAVMAEMFGKVDGCSKGRGGSMHLFDAANRFYGGNAIVAGGLPVAVGLALADKMQDRKQVTACFFGEGAVDEGEFHESLNLAAIWQLPVLFLCENNRYSMGMAVEKAEAEPDIYKKAAAYHVPGEPVDGMDVHAVEAAATAAAKAIRDGGGPRLLEFKTYRFRAHSMFDPELYRDKAEVAAWKEKGPVLAFEQQLRDAGLLEEDALAALEAEIAAEIDDAIQFAEASAWEPVETITRDVYAEEARP